MKKPTVVGRKGVEGKKEEAKKESTKKVSEDKKVE